ncbi:DUF3331 domain-containing protein (plasmid) [Burkholderia sp. M6-3]
MDECSSWDRILISLAVASGQSSAILEISALAPAHRAQPSTRRLPAATSWTRHRTSVRAIEPHGKSSLLVFWCDPTCCHYVDQLWINVMARKSGRCALTGLPIRRGDLIYKPQCRGLRVPANWHEMILFSALWARSRQSGLGDADRAIRHPSIHR